MQYKKGEGAAQQENKATFWYQRARQEGSQVATKVLQGMPVVSGLNK